MGSKKGSWDPWKMFDLSDKELDMMKRRKEIVMQRKAEFRRLVDNPDQGVDGHIFDPARQRWYSTRQLYIKTFKIDFNATKYFVLGQALTVLVCYIVYNERETAFQKYKTGELSTTHAIQKHDILKKENRISFASKFK